MDSGYASIEAPARPPEDLRLFGAPGGQRGKSASERRQFFTSSRMKGSVYESVDVRVFPEELEDEMTLGDCRAELEGAEPLEKAPPTAGNTLGDAPPQSRRPQLPAPPAPPTPPTAAVLKPLPPTSPLRPRLRRRDYSIDEKTDALFNEFLRHDPRFDQPESPLRARHRSRVHLRKQWQRHKQYSDPGAGAGRHSPSLDRQRSSPLHRGDSAGFPLDTRYHSTLSRIASAADEEGAEGGASDGAESRESSNQRAGGEATGSKGTDCEGGSTGCQASPDWERGGAVSANKDQASGSLETLIGQSKGTDPRVDNRNNNSSQAVQSGGSPSNPSSSPPGQNLPGAPADLPEHARGPSPGPDPADPLSPPCRQPHPQGSLADKLATTLEDRLYSGLRGQAGGPAQRGAERVGVVAVSPDHSPA